MAFRFKENTDYEFFCPGALLHEIGVYCLYLH